MENELIEYEDLSLFFPDGIDEDDLLQEPLIAKISPQCWKKMHEESLREAEEFGINVPDRLLELDCLTDETRQLISMLQMHIDQRKCSVRFAKRVFYAIRGFEYEFEPSGKWTHKDTLATKEWRESFFKQLEEDREKYDINDKIIAALCAQLC